MWDAVHTTSFFACSMAVFQPVPTGSLQEEDWVWFGDKSHQQLLQVRYKQELQHPWLPVMHCDTVPAILCCPVQQPFNPLHAIPWDKQHESFIFLPSKHPVTTLNVSSQINILTT